NAGRDQLAFFDAHAQLGRLDKHFILLQAGYPVHLRLAGVKLRNELQSPLHASPPSACLMIGYPRSPPCSRVTARHFFIVSLATCRAAALSHACPTASSNRLLNGALLGSCSTFSAFTAHCGHRTRYSSSTTVVWYSKHAKSRTSRSYTSQISLTRRLQLEHTTFWWPDLRRTHSFSALAASSISVRL